MKKWFTEEDNGDLRFSYAVKEYLHSSQSKFQKIEVANTFAYGKILIIDGFVMLSEHDEFVYHEMITHVPAALHKSPRSVLVIGGGDGGTVRELCKYKNIEKIVLCEIDEQVINVSKEFFPQLTSGLEDPRAEIVIADGVDYIKSQKNSWDLILIDSTDPLGPGAVLFELPFYQAVLKALNPNGIMACQSESPWGEVKILKNQYDNISQAFKYCYPYIAPVPTYPRGLWSWTIAQNKPDLNFHSENFAQVENNLKYLDKDILKASFSLPPFYRNKISAAKNPKFIDL